MSVVDTRAREALADVREGRYGTRSAAWLWSVTVPAIHAAASCQQGKDCTGPGCRISG